MTVHLPTPNPNASSGKRRGHRRSGVAVALMLAMIAGLTAYLLVAHTRSESLGPRSGTSGPAASGTMPLAPNGTFITVNGTTGTIASLRPKPTLVWFVAGGCASCAASIPAVAARLHRITSAGVQVLTLGLYEDFPSSRSGVAQLISFGQAAAGGAVTGPGWIWGMASKALSEAYDPSGTPDVYTLIGSDGRIHYRNSVPVSTMPQLLAAVQAVRLDPAPASAKSTGAIVPAPCC